MNQDVFGRISSPTTVWQLFETNSYVNYLLFGKKTFTCPKICVLINPDLAVVDPGSLQSFVGRDLRPQTRAYAGNAFVSAGFPSS